jgi:hypothetical protein
MKEECKLCFAGSTLLEAVLIVVKEVVIFQLCHDITDNDVFKDLA